MPVLAHIYDFVPYLLALAGLLFLSAFFSGSETALCALSRARVRRLRDSAGRSGRAVARLLAAPARLFTTVLVGNTLVNVALSSIVAALAFELLPSSGLYVAILISTFLLLVFGEITPKTFAVRSAERFSLFAARPLLAFSRMISPIRFVLRHFSNLLLAVFGLREIEAQHQLIEEEFEAMLQVGRDDGFLADHEVQIIRRIFELPRIDAKEIMVPRTRIIAAEQHSTIDELIQLAKRTRHWRIPIYDRDIDNIWGVFHFKDLPAWRRHRIEQLTVEQFVQMRDALESPPGFALVRPVFLIPQSQWIDILLTQMRQRGAHLAILLDEYGGTAGLVALEDILEEIVGEAFDGPQGPEALQRLQNQGLRLLGRARIREVNRRLALDIPIGDSDTIGGYVMSLFGDVPEVDERIDDGTLEFRVLKIAGRRIDALLVRRLLSPPGTADAPTVSDNELNDLPDL